MQSSRTVGSVAASMKKNRRVLAEVRTLAGQVKVTEQLNYPPSLLATTRARFCAKVKKCEVDKYRQHYSTISINQTAHT